MLFFIPNSQESQLIQQLLVLAWDRRLIFTVGYSVTTGNVNCVTWNDIHQKSEPYLNFSGQGFPDPNFLKNIEETRVLCVIEDDV